jgi:hypothetical protein
LKLVNEQQQMTVAIVTQERDRMVEEVKVNHPFIFNFFYYYLWNADECWHDWLSFHSLEKKMHKTYYVSCFFIAAQE